MTPDEQIGKRIAAFRKERDLSQAEFLRLLRTRGIDWNQATLSRIEGGSRALKLVEAFAVSDLLNIDPRDLGPDTSNLGYRIESVKLQLNELKTVAAQAIRNRNHTRNGLAALLLARSLRAGEDNYTVDSTAVEFVTLLAQWATPGRDDPWKGSYRFEDAADILRVRNDFEPHQEYSEDESDDYAEALEAQVRSTLSLKYPRLKFTGRESDLFLVPGLTESLDLPSLSPPMGTDGLWAVLQAKPQDDSENRDLPQIESNES